jgi:hypothetical protein
MKYGETIDEDLNKAELRKRPRKDTSKEFRITKHTPKPHIDYCPKCGQTYPKTYTIGECVSHERGCK